MKSFIPLIALCVLSIVGFAAFFVVSGPSHADHAARVQKGYDLSLVDRRCFHLRCELDAVEASQSTLLAAYSRQLADLAANPKDTQAHRELVASLSKSIAEGFAKIEKAQKRRREELLPLEGSVSSGLMDLANM